MPHNKITTVLRMFPCYSKNSKNPESDNDEHFPSEKHHFNEYHLPLAWNLLDYDETQILETI